MAAMAEAPTPRHPDTGDRVVVERADGDGWFGGIVRRVAVDPVGFSFSVEVTDSGTQAIRRGTLFEVADSSNFTVLDDDDTRALAAVATAVGYAHG